jgi:acyl-homoserine lactone synthase
MDVTIIEGTRPGASALLEQAFKLRHTVFVEEKKWNDLRKLDGREIDEFDGPQCIYILAVRKGTVLGHVRMTPTTHPHLLADVHARLCARPEPRGPHIWEWTRYCVRPRLRGRRMAGEVAAVIQVAAMEWLFMHGVRDVVVEYHPRFLERHLAFGFQVNPLGLPIEMEGEPVVAVHMQFDFNTIYQTRALLGVKRPILMREPVTAVS